jgi:putative MATE family efflux protein
VAAKPKPDLTNGAIGPALIAFAIPTLLSSVLQSLQGSINAIWVGRFLGEEALAATSNANLILFLTMAFVFGFGMAATILVGQAYGRRDIDQVRRLIGTVTGALVVVAVPLAAAGWVLAPQLLELLGLAPAAMDAALAYLRVTFLAIPPAMMMVMLMMALRGTGDAMTPLWAMLLAALVDCGLNPLLILGLGPFPEMGIAGSATASVIANCVCLGGMLVYVYARDLPVRLRGPELRYLRPDPVLVRRILGMGLPMGMQMIVLSLASLAMLGLVNREGVDTTAAFGVALQLWTYIQMPAMALSAAVSAMAAQNIGAGKWDRLGRIATHGIVFNIAMTGVLVAVLALADQPALELFLGSDSPAVPIARHLQLIATWSFVLSGVTIVLFGVTRANGVVWVPLIILAITMFPIRIGFAIGARGWLGADALWFAFPLSSAVSLAMAAAYYRWGNWRTRRMPIGPEAAVEQANATLEPEGRTTPSG